MLASVTSFSRIPAFITLLALSLPIFLVSRRVLGLRRRVQKVPRTHERVLILGASSGIGRALAHEYATKGSQVCVVARREGELKKVVEECESLSTHENILGNKGVFSVAADFTNVEDMVRLRATIQNKWKGVDTLIVCAGATALRPLMEVAGLERDGQTFTPSQAGIESIQHTVDVADAVNKVNYTGPLISAVTFLPLLQSSSASPSVLLISSLAALVPAPTRSLYASTKAASLMLYQALAIEHPTVAFSFAIPATVRGDFRASALDGGNPREVDPSTHGLEPKDVARRCAWAVDAGNKFVFVPFLYSRFGHLLYWLMPAFVEWRARVKYNFTA